MDPNMLMSSSSSSSSSSSYYYYYYYYYYLWLSSMTIDCGSMDNQLKREKKGRGGV